MGQKNAVTKRFCSDKIRFADLINGVYFHGREIIHPKEKPTIRGLQYALSQHAV